jgi:glucose/arabinose dehydrogenase
MYAAAMRTRGWLVVAVWLSTAIAPGRTAATVLDPAFTELPFVTSPALHEATGMAWAPDGSNRLFIISQVGGVRIIKDGVLLPQPFAQVTPVYTTSECGLIGIAFDPDFSSNRHVYLFVTVSPSEQQIIRYTANGDVGTDKTIVVPGLPTNGINHDGGAVGFGPADGKLYWAIGDIGPGSGVDGDLTLLASKVGRANLDGSPVSDNPFFDGAGPNADHIWARGFRNPFTFTFQPATGLLWVNDVGFVYEQIFIVRRGEHAGWRNHENNQPAGFITPVIKYRTNDVDVLTVAPPAMAGAVRVGGTVTVTTTATHGFRMGEKITVAGVAEPSFNGSGFVSAVPSATTFRMAQPGPDSSSGGGTAATLRIGGSVTGGTFYDATAFPAAYRGNFFFGDFNSGRIIRAIIHPTTNEVTSVDYWGTDVTGVVDMAVGPDGALYYIGFRTNTLLRASYNATVQALVVTPTNVWTAEGQASVVNVRLATMPTQPVTVTAARTGGDSDIAVAPPAGGSLIFAPATWQTPQPITVVAGRDLDTTDDAATIAITSAGLTAEEVSVRVRDENGLALVVAPTTLAFGEGASGTFTVALSRRPSLDVPVVVRHGGGDPDVGIASGAMLTFTSANWSAPQTVTVSAGQDADGANDVALLSVTSAGLPSQTVEVTARDDDARAPVIVSMPIVTAVLGVPYRYHVQASGLPVPAFTLDNPPAGMTIDRGDGLINWTPGASGSFMVNVRAANGVMPDATQQFVVDVSWDKPPDCSLLRPTPDEVVSGTMAAFSGEGTDDVGVARAEFHVDGKLSYTDPGRSGRFHHGGAPMLWDTTALPDGPHAAKILVFDTAGQTCAKEALVTVANGGRSDAGARDGGAAGRGVAGSPPSGGCDCRVAVGGQHRRRQTGSGVLALLVMALVARAGRRSSSRSR